VGLSAGVGEQTTGIEFFDGNAAAAVGEKIHGVTPSGMWFSRNESAAAAPPPPRQT
jgi:hypothetical protein